MGLSCFNERRRFGTFCKNHDAGVADDDVFVVVLFKHRESRGDGVLVAVVCEGDGGEGGHAGRGILKHGDEGFSEGCKVFAVITESAGKIGTDFHFLVSDQTGEGVERGWVFLTKLADAPDSVDASHEWLVWLGRLFKEWK